MSANKIFLTTALLAGIVGFAAAPISAQAERPKPGFMAALSDADGNALGTVSLTAAPKGVLVSADLSKLPPGWHAFHLHGTGDCADHEDHFKKSGPHAQRDGEAHGYYAPQGPHMGDFANFFVAADGTAKFEQFSQSVTADDLLDADGTAVLIHAKPDDYSSQPAGDAGDRLACGTVAKAVE